MHTPSLEHNHAAPAIQPHDIHYSWFAVRNALKGLCEATLSKHVPDAQARAMLQDRTMLLLEASHRLKFPGSHTVSKRGLVKIYQLIEKIPAGKRIDHKAFATAKMVLTQSIPLDWESLAHHQTEDMTSERSHPLSSSLRTRLDPGKIDIDAYITQLEGYTPVEDPEPTPIDLTAPRAEHPATTLPNLGTVRSTPPGFLFATHVLKHLRVPHSKLHPLWKQLEAHAREALDPQTNEAAFEFRGAQFRMHPYMQGADIKWLLAETSMPALSTLLHLNQASPPDVTMDSTALVSTPMKRPWVSVTEVTAALRTMRDHTVFNQFWNLLTGQAQKQYDDIVAQERGLLGPVPVQLPNAAVVHLNGRPHKHQYTWSLAKEDLETFAAAYRDYEREYNQALTRKDVSKHLKVAETNPQLVQLWDAMTQQIPTDQAPDIFGRYTIQLDGQSIRVRPTKRRGGETCEISSEDLKKVETLYHECPISAPQPATSFASRVQATRTKPQRTAFEDQWRKITDFSLKHLGDENALLGTMARTPDEALSMAPEQFKKAMASAYDLSRWQGMERKARPYLDQLGDAYSNYQEARNRNGHKKH